jgi:phosphoribosylaminoimidazole-succinocarboxamide synthase
VAVDDSLLEDLCERTLANPQFEGLGAHHAGKVRDSYVEGDRRTIIVSDRVSCFDVVVGTIPLKGQVLNQIAAFWFDKTRSAARNHLIEVPDPNVSIVRECRLLPVEFVVRGYLTGSSSTSIFTAYHRGERTYCGHVLPEGLRKHEKLAEPLLTPTTKAPKGEHDMPASRAELIASGAISEDLYDEAERITGTLFRIGTEWAAQCGLILVDTKYEIGVGPDGKLVVIDEIHTPDSSRYWYTDGYETAMSAGKDPKALDKEYVRLWLGEQGYKGDGTPPVLPKAVRCEAARRYIETYEQITRQPFEPNVEEPIARIRQSLGI